MRVGRRSRGGGGLRKTLFTSFVGAAIAASIGGFIASLPQHAADGKVPGGRINLSVAAVETPSTASAGVRDGSTPKDSDREFASLVFGAPVQASIFEKQVAPESKVMAGLMRPEPFVPLPPINPDRVRARTDVAQVTPKQMALPPRTTRVAQATPKAGASEDKRTFFEKLFGIQQPGSGPALAYAPADGGATDVLRRYDQNGPKPLVGEKTAVYDITAATVYMPNGKKLEAHSGLGQFKDNPESMKIRMRGVTPPNLYDLRLRESLFHGVKALRMTPADNAKMFGRDGILAHTYMLGPRGDSNGCVSFRDYPEFLAAFERGEVKRILVVTSASTMLAQAAMQSGG